MDTGHPIAQALADLLAGERTNIRDLDPDDPLRQPGLLIERVVTETVHFLRTPELFCCPKVNDLMGLVWNIIGQDIAPCAVVEGVPSVSFTVVSAQHGPQAVILMPPDWMQQMAADPLMQVGSLVFVGSQARDYYRGKIKSAADSALVGQRARAYEAEYLLALRATGYTKFNEYRRPCSANTPTGFPPSWLTTARGSPKHEEVQMITWDDLKKAIEQMPEDKQKDLVLVFDINEGVYLGVAELQEDEEEEGGARSLRISSMPLPPGQDPIRDRPEDLR